MSVVLVWPVLAFSFSAVLALIIIFYIFMSSITRRSSIDYFLTAGLVSAGSSFIRLLALSFASLVAIVFGIFTHVVSYWKFYLVAFSLGVTLGVLSTYNGVIIKNVDKYTTEFVLPAYNEIVLPVLNLFRIAYELAIPWWNLFVELIRLIPYITFTTLRECSDNVDTRSVLLSFAQLYQAVFTLISAILVDLESEILISDVYVAFARVIDSFSEWVNCFCQEMAFAWNIIVFYIHQNNFQKSGGPTGITILFPPSHDIINALYALIVTFFRFVANLVIDAVDGGSFDPFDCGPRNIVCDPLFNGTCNFYVDCQIFRPPHWNIAFDYACDFVKHWLGSLDDIIWCAVLLFINANADAVPRPFAIIEGVICFLIRLTQGFFDFIFKIDLVFDQHIKYASRINVTLQFTALRQTPIAIVAFFNTFLVPELSYIGCAIADFLNSVIGILEFVIEFAIAFSSFDINHIVSFLENYDYDAKIAAPFERAIICAEKAIELINKEWAVAFKYTMIVFSRAINLLALTFSRFGLLFGPNPEDYLTWYAAEVIPLVFNLCDVMQRWTIALGNCIRTFDVFLEYFGMNENCIQQFNATYPEITKTAFIVGIDTHSNMFCVSGDAIQVVSQFIISLVQLAVQLGMSIVSIINNPSTSQGFYLLRNLLDNLKFFVFKCIRNAFEVINGYLSSLGSFFGCQDSDGNFSPQSGVPGVGTKLKRFFSSFTNITNFPLNIILLNGETLGLIIQCALEPTSIPIFLQDLSGCEGQTFRGTPIGPPRITSCSSASIFDNIVDVICRYIFEFWDYVFIWFPFIIIRLVDFIICLAQEGSANNTIFNELFDLLNTLRCLICDIVKIIVAIFRALVYLFTDGGFNDFFSIIKCFPPINTIVAVINTIIYIGSHIGGLFSGSITISSVYESEKRKIRRFCSPRTPPCGIPADATLPVGYPPELPWPPEIPESSPQLPCWIVDSFLFKRATNSKRSLSGTTFDTIPFDGQSLLISSGWLWNASNPLYNFSMPQSPCYSNYRYIISTQNATIASPEFWMNSHTHVLLKECIISSEVANKLNAIMPFSLEHPIPPDFLTSIVSLANYSLILASHIYSSISYISYRTSVGGSDLASWTDFKNIYGITNNFPLTLISLFDQATTSASMILSALDKYPRYSSYIHSQYEKRGSNKGRPFSWEEWKKTDDFLFPPNGTNRLTGKDYVKRENEEEEDFVFNSQFIAQERQEIAKRVETFQPRGLGDLITTDIDLGHTLGLALHSAVNAWRSFEAVNNLLADTHIGGLLWKRSIKGTELKRGVVEYENERRRKRGDPSIEEFTFQEISAMQARYNAHSLRSHITVLVNFTQTSFFVIGNILMRGINNTFSYKSTEEESPFLMRRGIRNFMMTVRSSMEKHIPGREGNSVARQSINVVYQKLEERRRSIERRAEFPPPPLRSALLVIGNVEDTITYEKRTSGSLEFTRAVKRKAALLKDARIIDREEMIHLSGNYYTRYEESNQEMPLYEKRDELVVDGHEVFFAINYPDNGFKFGDKVFPLADLCIGPSRLSNALPPPFGNKVIPGFCFNCKVMLNSVNAIVYYMGVAINDTANITARINVDQSIDPEVRKREMRPCTTGPAEPSTTPCCGNCECHTGTCMDAVNGTCSLSGEVCCSRNSSNPNVCPDFHPTCNTGTGFCNIFISVPCVDDMDCPPADQFCQNFAVGWCGPAPTSPAPTPCAPFYVSGDSWNTVMLHVIWLVPSLFTDICAEEALDSFLFFFTGETNTPDTIRYWIEFIFICDFVESTHCDSADFSGTGLISGFFWTYGVILGVAALLQLMGVPSVVFTYLFIFSPVVWLSVSYFYCPICYPALPLCVANDAYFYLYSIGLPCINWQPIFGDSVSPYCSLSEPQCYHPYNKTYFAVNQEDGLCPNGTTSLDPYERVFPDCTEEPYNFDSPLRPFFYVAQLIWPEVVDWLKLTQSPTLRYIRELPNFDDGLQFKQADSIPNDELACLVLTGFSTIGHLAGYGLLLAFIALLIFFVVQIVIALVQLTLTLIIIAITPMVYYMQPDVKDGPKGGVDESVEDLTQQHLRSRRSNMFMSTSSSLSRNTNRIFSTLSRTQK